MRPQSKAVGAAVAALAAGLAIYFEGRPQAGYLDRLPLRPTPTACHGHTGPDVEVGHIYSDAQCKAWLDQDIATANATVHRCVARVMPVEVEAALTDFTLNEGPGRAGEKDGFCVLKSGKSSTIRRLAQAGDWRGVCDQFQYWTSAGGKRLPGLVKRRAAEAEMCRRALLP